VSNEEVFLVGATKGVPGNIFVRPRSRRTSIRRRRLKRYLQILEACVMPIPTTFLTAPDVADPGSVLGGQ